MLLRAARRPDGSSLPRHTVPGGVGERRRARRVSDRTANQDNSQSLTGRRERRRPAETLVKSPAPVSFQVGNADPIPAAASKKNRRSATPQPTTAVHAALARGWIGRNSQDGLPGQPGSKWGAICDPRRAVQHLLQRSLRCPTSDLPTPRRGQTTTVISVKASGLPESAGLWGRQVRLAATGTPTGWTGS